MVHILGGFELNLGNHQDAHLLHPPNPPWHGMNPHSVASTAPLAAAPLGFIPWDLKHPQWLGLHPRSGHFGGPARKFDSMLLDNTKITSEAYFHNWLGYNMVFLPEVAMATGGKQGGVVLVVREGPQGWSV